MTFHEFGQENPDVIVMFHPLSVWWDIFELVIPCLQRDWHLVIPAMPGHDPDRPGDDFTSVEQIADETAEWLASHGHARVRGLYGCSMGGGVVARMLADGRIGVDRVVIDAGMTPYRLPRPVTWLIGVRDWCMCEFGKYASISALRGVFDPGKYSEEDLRYVKKVLSGMSARTIWRGFYSANNYAMPRPVPKVDCPIQYWYGSEEKQARKWDIAYIRQAFPQAEFVENAGQGHAEYFTLHPEAFSRQLTQFMR